MTRLQTKLFLTTLLFCLSIQAFPQASSKITIDFNKNVELFGYMVFLAEPDQNDINHPITKIISGNMEDVNIGALHEIYNMAGTMPYAFFVQLFYALPTFPLDSKVELPQQVIEKFGYQTPDEQEKVRKLVALANRFYLESNFEEIYQNLAKARHQVINQMKAGMMSDKEISNLEAFYGQVFDQYLVVPSLTIWSGPGWGFPTQLPDSRSANFILGPLSENYDFSDTERLRNLTIHEFGHSFVNKVLFESSRELIEETELLYPPIQSSMTKQAYPDWASSITEHFVRAGEIIIPEHFDEINQQELMQNYTVDRSFIYLPFIVERLSNYRLEQKLDYPKSVRKTMEDLVKKAK